MEGTEQGKGLVGTENTNKEQQNEAAANKTEQKEQKVDVAKITNDAVSNFLNGLGYDEETLKAIVSKHEKEEESNKTDLEKVQGQLKKATQMLTEERQTRMIAEAKLAAMKLGARPDLVDDLVTVAMSKVTKDKDVDAVISEIKSGNTGSVYFGTKEDQMDVSVVNLTGGTRKTNGDGNGEAGSAGESKGTGDSIMDRIRKNKERAAKKKYYFS